MIIGLGSDLCNIERIQNSLDRFGDRFIQRVFTPVEQAKAFVRTFAKPAAQHCPALLQEFACVL